MYFHRRILATVFLLIGFLAACAPINSQRDKSDRDYGESDYNPPPENVSDVSTSENATSGGNSTNTVEKTDSTGDFHGPFLQYQPEEEKKEVRKKQDVQEERGIQQETYSQDPPVNIKKTYYGKAVYISDDLHGRPTASGERYDRNKLTAAHPFLPFGTICRVTNVANGRTVNVRINDRCKNWNGRIIDLSYEAATRLDAILAGVIRVKLDVIKTVDFPE